jgi:hypothetical protein
MLARTSNTIASPLSRKATLISITISQWTARKLDKRVTDKVNREHGASKDAGRYNKLLIEAQRLKKINSFVSQARTLHYSLTKPWADEGMRILPNVLHAKFADGFRKIKRGFDEAVDEFARDYPAFIEERKRALNGLFNAADYPSPEQIASKFKLEAHPYPVPVADDFRSDVLDDDMVEDIRREIAETSDQVLTDAVKHSAQQIVKVVSHMSEKLKEYKAGKGKGKKKAPRSFFAASLVDNVRELADLLPAFNLNDDPELARITDRITKELCAEDATTLRDNEATRVTVQKSADDILKDVSSLLG